MTLKPPATVSNDSWEEDEEDWEDEEDEQQPRVIYPDDIEVEPRNYDVASEEPADDGEEEGESPLITVQPSDDSPSSFHTGQEDLPTGANDDYDSDEEDWEESEEYGQPQQPQPEEVEPLNNYEIPRENDDDSQEESKSDEEPPVESLNDHEITFIPPPQDGEEEEIHYPGNYQLDSDHSHTSATSREKLIDRVLDNDQDDHDFNEKSSNLGWSSDDEDLEQGTTPTRQQRALDESRQQQSRTSAFQTEEEPEYRPYTNSAAEARSAAVGKASSMATVYLALAVCFIFLGIGCAIAAIILRDEGRTR